MANSGKIIQKFFRLQFSGVLATLCDIDGVPENSSSIFPNWKFQSSFSGENRSVIFCVYLFSFCKISGHELDRFLENLSIFGWVSEKSIFVTPRYSLNIIFRLNALFWITFPEIGLCHVSKFLNLTIGWVFQKSV